MSKQDKPALRTAVITLTDLGDGNVQQMVSYGDHFEPKSQAHQFAGIMVKLAGDFVRGQLPDAPKAEPAKSMILLG